MTLRFRDMGAVSLAKIAPSRSAVTRLKLGLRRREGFQEIADTEGKNNRVTVGKKCQ